MPKLLQYVFILFFAILIVKYFIYYIKVINKSNKFLKTHFNEDKLYSSKEVSKVFHLNEKDFLNLLQTLEDYNYFIFFKRRGVTMVKDYYSKYELKFLLRLLSKKEKLKI